jgi:hypothetical protein
LDNNYDEIAQNKGGAKLNGGNYGVNLLKMYKYSIATEMNFVSQSSQTRHINSKTIKERSNIALNSKSTWSNGELQHIKHRRAIGCGFHRAR